MLNSLVDTESNRKEIRGLNMAKEFKIGHVLASAYSVHCGVGHVRLRQNGPEKAKFNVWADQNVTSQLCGPGHVKVTISTIVEQDISFYDTTKYGKTSPQAHFRKILLNISSRHAHQAP